MKDSDESSSKRAALEKRLDTLEAKAKAANSKEGKGLISWALDVLKVIVPGAILAVVGYVLNDTVNQALKARELKIDAIKEMQALSAALQKPDIEKEAAIAQAAVLAAYGEYSVPFFINVQEIGNQYAIEGASQGLRMVARSEPQAVCEQLTAVIRNRTGLYNWQSHLAALQLIGEVRCDPGAADVRAYREGLDSLTTLVKWVAKPPPEESEFEIIRSEVQTATERLARPVPPAPSKPWFGTRR